MSNEIISVDYRFPPEIDAEKQAKIIAIGQTAGTWDDRFAHRETQLRKHLAEVAEVKSDDRGYNIATVHFPIINVENDIASLLTMIFGKYSMAGMGKIVGVHLPEGYGTKAKFGMSGMREQLGAIDRPLIMAIFKPALGLSAKDHGDLFQQVAEAGLDAIKDDEIMGDLATAPTLERLAACRPVFDRIQEKQGRKIFYAVNVTGKATELAAKARLLVKNGANALLLNVLTYGFSVLEDLASDPEINVPIFAHPAFAGAICGAPDTGIAYSVILGTLMARGGADAVLYPAHYGNLPFEAEEEIKIRDILRKNNVFPVPSAGIRAEIIPQILDDYGCDVILNSGTGIMEHPSGAAAGVKAFIEACAAYGESERLGKQ
jgi:2,3-diketo-5-methylthiopentyl-1-phosphate enolase